jgi:hypothetical protein
MNDQISICAAFSVLTALLLVSFLRVARRGQIIHPAEHHVVDPLLFDELGLGRFIQLAGDRLLRGGVPGSIHGHPLRLDGPLLFPLTDLAHDLIRAFVLQCTVLLPQNVQIAVLSGPRILRDLSDVVGSSQLKPLRGDDL